MAVAANGTVYVSYLRYRGQHAYPVVAISFDHGRTFAQVASLIPARTGNWGDHDFIAAGPGGTVYVTWDYGPSIADVKIVCSPVGSCAYGAVDANAVVQKSTDYGKTWGPITVGALVIPQVEASAAHIIPQGGAHVIPHRDGERVAVGVVLASRRLLPSDRIDGSPDGEENFRRGRRDGDLGPLGCGPVAE